MNRTKINWIKGGEVVHTSEVFSYWDEVNESLLQKLYEGENHKTMEQLNIKDFDDYLAFTENFMLEIVDEPLDGERND